MSDRFLYSDADLGGITVTRKPRLKYADGTFITKFNEDQARDERGRFSTEAGGDTLTRSDANTKIWSQGLGQVLDRQFPPNMLRSTVSTETRGQLKSVVTANIAEKLSEFDARRLADLALTGPTQAQYVNIALAQVDETIAAGEKNFVGIDEHGFLNAVSGERFVPESYVPAGTPEAAEVVRLAATSALIGQWALTSNNEDYRSLAIQEIAAQTFGIQDHADWWIGREDTTEKMNNLMTEHGDVLRAFVTAQYESTQEFLNDNNIKSIELYRGMGVDEKTWDKVDENKGSFEFQTRPLTSWTTDNLIAQEFKPRSNGIIMSATIPADRIFSLPLTGIGCLSEAEVVVLGGLDSVNATTDREF